MKARGFIIALLAIFLVAATAPVGLTSAADNLSRNTLQTRNLNTTQLQAAPATVVVGADDPLVDVPAVQAAVDQGGTVVLRGTFDFGTHAGNHIIVPGREGAAQDQKGKSTVFVYQHDVTVLGETGPQGELLTVVRNGMPAFWVGWDGEVTRVSPPGTLGVDYGVESFPEDAQGRVAYRDGFTDPDYAGPQTRYARAYQNVSATFRSIYFDSPKHYGVKATAGRDIYVIGNTFKNVQFGGLVHFNNLYPATHIAAAFVGVGSLYAPFIGPAITGSVVAERNVVDDVGTEVINTHAGESVGLGAIATLAAVRIERNEVRNVGRKADGTASEAAATSLLVTENYAAAPVIAHNTVYNSSGNGIWDLALFAPSPGPKIEHNTVLNCATGILVYSLIGPRPGLLIHQNAISQDGPMSGGQSCIVAVQMTTSIIRANRFEGEWAGPLVVLSGSTDNMLLENRDLRAPLPPWPPTYFLDGSSSGNLVRGASGNAFDLGTSNTVLLRGPQQ